MYQELNRKLKERIHRGPPLLVPGAFDALTARIIEDIGFEAAYITGAGVSNSYLGLPDLGFLTLTEIAHQTSVIRDAVELPLIVDADTGFGNALNVGRTVKVLERSGANAIQLEDQEFPKRCGHFSGKGVIPTAEMIQKIHAAVDARLNSNFIIIARTDARATHGFEEALERVLAYFDAGADVTFLEAPQSHDEIAAIPERVRCPQLINMVEGGVTPLKSISELTSLKYAIVLYANAALRAAILGMQKVLTELYRSGSTEDVLLKMAQWEERQRLVKKPMFDDLEKKYKV